MLNTLHSPVLLKYCVTYQVIFSGLLTVLNLLCGCLLLQTLQAAEHNNGIKIDLLLCCGDFQVSSDHREARGTAGVILPWSVLILLHFPCSMHRHVETKVICRPWRVLRNTARCTRFISTTAERKPRPSPQFLLEGITRLVLCNTRNNIISN